MSAEVAEVVKMLVAVNAISLVVLVPLSFIGSALALEGLEKLDLWMRRRVEKRMRQHPPPITPDLAPTTPPGRHG